jgi:hypothetical protein
MFMKMNGVTRIDIHGWAWFPAGTYNEFSLRFDAPGKLVRGGDNFEIVARVQEGNL